ncbi:MAG: ABC transporter ATP-binding protein [Lachnospiraceae bacterium]|jgi:branched-chain amino acid transport system ATP-binding protein|nr:ABC transporter ATP-binding protein [Lachnospiraceae bacterium]MDD4524659.1 ABC transporter ATP-binding protein [Lachnospiraceae bacterium]
MTNENVLTLSDITMQFGGVVAVNNLSLDVGQGEIVALIGPNGAGKTTVFNVITGVYEATNGSVTYKGETMLENYPGFKMRKTYGGSNAGKYTKRIVKTPDVITSVGIARTFQNIRLFKDLSVLENVMIAMHMHLKSGYFSDMLHMNRTEEQKLRQDSIDILEMVGLGSMLDDQASSLPYGQQRKLEIARALATKPSLLLLDEPAAGMNPQETLELSHFIVEIRNHFNLSVLMIEHHMDLVMSIADRIYVLNFGELIASGTPAEVQNNKSVIDAYLGANEDA